MMLRFADIIILRLYTPMPALRYACHIRCRHFRFRLFTPCATIRCFITLFIVFAVSADAEPSYFLHAAAVI